jgi:2-hydroxychromene-2-carboxylate isomerase
LKQLTWYFDVISPFAYLQSTQLARLALHANITFKPIVFAGLLQHFGNIGPAEIVPKRQWTFEQVAWMAHVLGVPFKLPAAHPFNPVSLLRAIVAAGSTAQAVQAVFEYVWVQRGDLNDINALHRVLGITTEAASTSSVKAELIANGQMAIANQVFGVPTAVVDGKNFWGVDSTDMLLAYLKGDQWFESAAYLGVKDFPQGVQRRK